MSGHPFYCNPVTHDKMDHIVHFFPGYLKPFQCMLAAKKPNRMTDDEFLKALRLPLHETPKIDGIRCVTLDIPGDLASWYCTPVTRHMKPIPNKHIRGLLGEHCPPGLDGELVQIVRQPDGTERIAGYYETSSAILSYDGTPTFKYMVFDYITPETRLEGYLIRLEKLRELSLPRFCEVLEPRRISTIDELRQICNERIDQGFEGSCLRTGVHEYKFGRSSLRQQALVAVKPFVDGDGEVIGVKPLCRNVGTPRLNAQGHLFRERKKENLVPDEMLGKLIARDLDTKREFAVGSGFTQQQRIDLWLRKETLIGRHFKYKHQAFGAVEGGKPREPVFLGWREKR